MNFPEEINVNVTQEDIDNGVPVDCQKCAIALPFNRLFPDHRVSVGVTNIAIHEKAGRIVARYSMPDSARQLQEDFDMDKKVYPLQFTSILRYAS